VSDGELGPRRAIERARVGNPPPTAERARDLSRPTGDNVCTLIERFAGGAALKAPRHTSHPPSNQTISIQIWTPNR